LNELKKDKSCYYFWQATRYFPEGREAHQENNHQNNPSGILPLPESE
jgi:hypothetical protein